ncbi:hypothetical protein ACLD0W_12750 [Alloalcanivorax sp. C16-1]|uniref:hypothetical protein n=1 Tax=Alloalcanivorax sp. C16-1 TaxID=3390051 RepID=UPI0039709D59
MTNPNKKPANSAASTITALVDALNYLLEQTVDQDLANGIGLTEGEREARERSINVIYDAQETLRQIPKVSVGDALLGAATGGMGVARTEQERAHMFACRLSGRLEAEHKELADAVWRVIRPEEVPAQ